MKRARKEDGGASTSAPKKRKSKQAPSKRSSASIPPSTAPAAPPPLAPASDLNFWSPWMQLALPSVASLVNYNSWLTSPLLPSLADPTFNLPPESLKRPGPTPPKDNPQALRSTPVIFDLHSPPVPRPHIPVTPRQRSILMSLHSSHDIEDFLYHISREDELGYDVDIQLDNDGNTSSHWAAYLGRVDILRVLQQYGADLAVPNHKGETPLMRAVQSINCHRLRRFKDILQYLKDTMTARDCDGRTVLHHAAWAAGSPARAEAAEYYLQCISDADEQSMFMEDDDLDAKDRQGDTAIHLACRAKNKTALEILLEMGCGPDVKNYDGLSPRDVAAGSRSLLRRLASKVAVVQTDSEDEGEGDVISYQDLRDMSPTTITGPNSPAGSPRMERFNPPTLPPSPSPSIHSISDFLPPDQKELYPNLPALRDTFSNQLTTLDETSSILTHRLQETRRHLSEAQSEKRHLESEVHQLHILEQKLDALYQSQSSPLTPPSPSDTPTEPTIESLKREIEDFEKRIGRSDRNQERILGELKEVRKEGIGGKGGIYKRVIAWCCRVGLEDVDGILEDLDRVVGGG
ncbi:transcriptional regulator swi6, partial [Rhizophlyctis rosea]